MNHAAPVARLALAFGAGISAGAVGVPLWVAPLLGAIYLAAPIASSPRPGRTPWAALLPALLAGWLVMPSEGTSCVPDARGETTISGHFLATPRDGSAPFLLAGGCGPYTVVVDAGSGPSENPAGRVLAITGRWQEGRHRPWFQATATATVDETGRPVDAAGGRVDAAGRALVRWRDRLVGRLPRLYGERAPLVSALVFARREGMDRTVRDAFAATGIAHLLAISGFHVGVVAGLVLALLRGLGVTRRRAGLGAAAAAWTYVAFIGLPDAACRAALILGLVAASRARGRPPSRWGALAVAALVLLVTDPGRATSAGFQLSFAGAAGLVAWSGPLGAALARITRGRLPRPLVSAVAAGVAATLATLPIVAWHFERVSLVGIPMTLLASPLVSLALPGALLSIVVDPFAPGVASFLAGGVDVLLAALVHMTTVVAAWPGVSLWATRAGVAAAMAGVTVASWLARRPGIGRGARHRLVGAYVTTAVVAWPLAVGLAGRGTLELYAIDVGQGDAIALKTPSGRWLLVDAGPPVDGPVPTHPVVRALRGRGVRRLESLVITHPDADHFGGAAAVLESFDVAGVVDPLLAAPKAGYVDVLAAARRRGVPWSAARAGMVWTVDGVRITVLHPTEASVSAADANDASVVLLVEWEGFGALLTGDAGAEVERAVAPVAGDVDVLKVGHHGSETSSAAALLDVVRPELAVISVGRRNRYGHPAPGVVRRLEEAGARILRTDVMGDVRLVVRPGSVIEVRGGDD